MTLPVRRVAARIQFSSVKKIDALTKVAALHRHLKRSTACRAREFSPEILYATGHEADIH